MLSMLRVQLRCSGRTSTAASRTREQALGYRGRTLGSAGGCGALSWCCCDAHVFGAEIVVELDLEQHVVGLDGLRRVACTASRPALEPAEG